MQNQLYNSKNTLRDTGWRSPVAIIACVALLLSLGQAAFVYYLYQKSVSENVVLRLKLAELQTEMREVSIAGRRAVRSEVDAQLAPFIRRAEKQLEQTTMEVLKTRRLIIVDKGGGERISLGTGFSEFSKEPNASIISLALRLKIQSSSQLPTSRPLSA